MVFHFIGCLSFVEFDVLGCLWLYAAIVYYWTFLLMADYWTISRCFYVFLNGAFSKLRCICVLFSFSKFFMLRSALQLDRTRPLLLASPLVLNNYK